MQFKVYFQCNKQFQASFKVKKNMAMKCLECAIVTLRNLKLFCYFVCTRTRVNGYEPLCICIFVLYRTYIYFFKNREKAIISNNFFFRILRLPNEKVLLSKGVMYIVIYFPFVTKCLLICMFVDMSLNDKATCTEYSMLL